MGTQQGADGDDQPREGKYRRATALRLCFVVVRTGRNRVGKPNYGIPQNGILNGYNIKYLIRMPHDYFDSQGGRRVEAKDTKKRWGDFSDNLSKWLAGTDNVNKSMLIKYLRGTDGKMLDNVDVVPLKNEMSDDEYDKAGRPRTKPLQTRSVSCRRSPGCIRARVTIPVPRSA